MANIITEAVLEIAMMKLGFNSRDFDAVHDGDNIVASIPFELCEEGTELDQLIKRRIADESIKVVDVSDKGVLLVPNV